MLLLPLCAVSACSFVSICLRPHGLWLTRLLRPWDSPGENTGGHDNPCPPPGDLRDPGIKTMSPFSPALQVDSLLNEPLEKLLLFGCLSNLLLPSFYEDTGNGI